MRGSIAGLAFLVAGCVQAPRETFDLAVAPPPVSVATAGPVLAVREPTATPPTSSPRVVVRAPDGSVALLPDAQWSEPLPRLLRARMIEALQRRGVAASWIGYGSNRALATDIRRFEIDAARNVAVVEIAAYIVDESSGATRAGRSFAAEAPTSETIGPDAVRALAQAAAQVFAQTADWARGR
ncbi:ABC-type transport auxiliary lipoprotein family protein [Methylocystis iwaonis]|uniref:ABC-type transport auxiliary lipoprotein family protein n=1 Tax=Methylocystis iwaonis TaxID=2885079 RepID=UPI002E7AD4AF|nr:ABC-type transport auxiliary lipoprotein family protein [Methylocystis iwaonis]